MLRRPAHRRWRPHPLVISLGVLFTIALWRLYPLLHTTWTLISMPMVWSRDSSTFMLPTSVDDFDITFDSYNTTELSASPGHADKIPAIFHHIAFGSTGDKWKDARQSCLDLHPGWEAHLWDEEKAREFVAAKYPEMKEMWEGYRHPIQKIDSLRYMVLDHYGGVILDMDLHCNRALGPLRRFDFVAPLAHPAGISNGFMMAAKGNELMKDAIRKLEEYNRSWFFLPYSTVMFSTGCHFISTIHTLQRDRSAFKVLGGTADRPRLHSLNGHVSTPLFDHLGSSSWHSFDAALIVWLGRVKLGRCMVPVMICVTVVALVLLKLRLRRWLKERRLQRLQRLEEKMNNV